jgi:hypothetical protein
MTRLKSIHIIVFYFILLSASCKKSNIQPGVDQLSLLPPATQTGANTFGCLLNGQAFVPNSPHFLQAPVMQCNYVYLNGSYIFSASGAYSSSNSDGSDILITIRTDSLSIAEGETLNFKANKPGNASASYILLYATGGLNEYDTNSSISGQMTITKLDHEKYFVSGTFYFTAVNNKNDTVKVTNGRFDMPYQ